MQRDFLARDRVTERGLSSAPDRHQHFGNAAERRVGFGSASARMGSMSVVADVEIGAELSVSDYLEIVRCR